jgi:hypothetical protein
VELFPRVNEGNATARSYKMISWARTAVVVRKLVEGADCGCRFGCGSGSALEEWAVWG